MIIGIPLNPVVLSCSKETCSGQGVSVDNSPATTEQQRLPFGILPSPRRLRRRPAAGILPARSDAPIAPDASTEHPRGNGRGTPRESDTRRVVWRAGFHPWRDPLRVSQPHVRINAIFCDLMRRYAPICDLLRFYAAAPFLSVYERKSAYMCFCVDGKMCNVGPQTKVCDLHCRPYSRFALDGILLCEAGGRCRDQEGTGRLFGEMAPQ